MKLSSYIFNSLKKTIQVIEQIIQFHEIEATSEDTLTMWHDFVIYDGSGVPQKQVTDYPVNLDCDSAIMIIISSLTYHRDHFCLDINSVMTWVEKLFKIPRMSFKPNVDNVLRIVKCENLDQKIVQRILNQFKDFQLNFYISYLDISITIQGVAKNLILSPTPAGLMMVSYEDSLNAENNLLTKKNNKQVPANLTLPADFIEVTHGDQLPAFVPPEEHINRNTLEELLRALTLNIEALHHQQQQQAPQGEHQDPNHPQPPNPPGDLIQDP